MKLSYLSSRAAGYKSVLKITMTQAVIPFNLMKVHLMVAVVGRLFQKWFPASPNLAYTFIWDKTDAYNQKVYGLSEAVGKFHEYPIPSALKKKTWSQVRIIKKLSGIYSKLSEISKFSGCNFI